MQLKKEVLDICPLCGSDNIQKQLSGEYGIFHCLACDVRFTNPRPIAQDLPKIYLMREQGMDLGDQNKLSLFLKKLKLRPYITKLIKLINKQAFSLLDYGCGDGLIALEFAQKKGCREAWATDFADQPPALIAKKHDAKVQYVPLNELNEKDKKFDVIIMRHVLEHVPFPRITIDQLRNNLLWPDGVIIFEVPNIDSLWSRIFKENYNQLALPQHLVHFSRKALLNNFPGIEVFSTNIPVLGPSLVLSLGGKISNIGLFAAILYLPQVLLDLCFNSSNAFLIKMKGCDK